MNKLKLLWKMYTSHDSQIFQLGFAYSILLSLVPILIIFIVLFNRFALDTAVIVEVFGNVIDEELLYSFIRFFSAENSGEFLSLIILLLISINLGSRAFMTYQLLTQNIEKTHYKWWFLKLRALVGLITFVVFFVGAVFITTQLGWNNSFVQFFFFIFALLLVYRSLALEHRSIENVYKGALIAGLGLYGMTFALYYFFNNIFNYQSIYGPLASLMVLFLSIYILAKIIHLGYCVNYVFRNKSTEGKAFWLYEKIEGESKLSEES